VQLEHAHELQVGRKEEEVVRLFIDHLYYFLESLLVHGCLDELRVYVGDVARRELPAEEDVDILLDARAEIHPGVGADDEVAVQMAHECEELLDLDQVHIYVI
jgi:hypothetical protein